MASQMTGRFEGYFFTEQKRPLDVSEFLPTDNAHRVHLYQGTLHDARLTPVDTPPDTIPPRDALWLYQVPNVEVHPANGNGLPYVSTFREIVLRNVEVLNSWNLDGKTYGHLRADFTGVRVDPLSSPDDLPTEPTAHRHNVYSTTPPESTLHTGRRIPTDLGEATSVAQSGFTGLIDRWSGDSGRNNRPGCLRWLWILLGFLALLALLSLLLRGCGGSSNGSDDRAGNSRELVRCEETNQRLERQQKKLESENKRLQRQVDSLTQELDLAELNCTLKNYAQRIYFYGNTDDIREYSAGPIRELADLMQKYPDIRIRIEGHVNPTDETPEEFKDLDQRRAQRVKGLLTRRGIREDRIEVVGKGATDPIVPPHQLDTDPGGNKYNKNMRVVIKIIQ